MDICFDFDGKDYVVGGEAYERSGPIVLPDHTLLGVGAWLETFPPQPSELKKIEGLELASTPEETAKMMGGTLAREDTKN